MKRLHCSVLRLAIPVLFSVAAAVPAFAQTTYYWDGNGATTGSGTAAQNTGTWGGASASSDWSTSPTGTATTTSAGPGVLDTAVFGAYDGTAADSPSGSYTVTLGANESLAGIQLGTTASNGDGTASLALGTNTLTIGSGGITLSGSSGDPSITSSGAGSIIIGASQSWTINNAHVLAVSANVAGAATTGNTEVLTLGYVGAYSPTLSGVVSDGSAGGTLGLTISNTSTGTNTGGGTWTIGGTANSYTGVTSISHGTLVVTGDLANGGSNSSLGASTSAINFGSTTYTGTLIYNSGTNSSSNRGINLAGTTGGATIYNNSTGTLNLSGAVTSAGGTNTLTLGGAGTTGTNVLSGLISDSSGAGSGTTSLVVTGAANWSISNGNTIGGTFTTSNTEATYTGTLAMNGNNTFNNAGNDVTVTGGTVTMNGSNSFNGNVVVSGGTLILGGVNSGFGNYTVTGGVLDLNSNNDGVGTLSVSGGGTVIMSASGSLASAAISLNNGFLLLGGSGNVDSSNGITIGTSGGGIGVTYTPTSFPTFHDNSGTTGGVFGIGYTGTGGIGSVSNITALFGSTSYWSLGAFTGSNGTYTGTSLPVGALSTYRLGGGGGTLTVQNAFLTGSANNLQIGTPSSGGTVNLPTGETYGGTTSVINGTVGITSASSLGTSTTAITLGSGSNAVGINYLGTGETISRALNFAGTTGTVTLSNSGSGAVVYSATPTFTGVGAKTLILGNATDTVGGSIGAITNGGTGVTSVTKNGADNSVWTLTGGSANTYTGTTTINQGVLQTTNVTDLTNSFISLTNGSSSGTLPINDAVFQTQGTLSRTLSSTAASANLYWGEDAGFAAYGGTLTLSFNGGAQLVWGTGFDNGSTGGIPVVFGSTTSNNQVIFQNALSLGTTDPFQQNIYVYKGTGGDSTLFSGVISNGTGTGSASGIVKEGLGTLILSGANTYSGLTTVSQGTLVAGTNSAAAGLSTTGAFGSGDGPSATPAPATYSIITLGNANTGASGNPSLLIGGAYTVARPISITDSGTNNVYSIGGSTDAVSTFSGAISFVNSGGHGNTFNVTQVATTGSDVLNLTGGISGGAAGTQTVNFANVGAVSVNTTGITNGGGTTALIQSGSGTTTLAATNTYTGATTINAGTLYVSGSLASGSAVAINSGGTLAGNGTAAGAVSVASGGAINLRDGVIGTLHTGALTLGTGSTALSFDIGSGSTGNLDSIAVTGALTLNGTSTITIGNVSGTPTLTNGTYSLITYTGSALTTAQFNDLTLGTTTLDGKTLSLVNGATGASGVELMVSSAVVPGTNYSLSVAAGANLLHQGGTTTVTSTVTNTGTGSADTLNYSGLGASSGLGNGVAGATTSGGPLANNGGTASNSQTYTATTTGTDTISPTGSGTNANAGGSATLTSSTSTTLSVYSGKSTWAGTGTSGAWGSLATGFGTNWGASQGSPGLDPNFKGVDTATFGAVSGNPANYTVNLNDAAPNLNSITFNAPSTSYTLAQGTGSNGITLSGTTPSINVAASGGTHTIAAPITLGATTAVNVASGQQLTMSGPVSGGYGLSNTGAGRTFLSNATGNSYSGGTMISAGRFYVNNTSGSGTGSGSVTVQSGGTLAGSGFIAPTSAGLTVQSGGTLASGGVQTSNSTHGAVTGTGLTFTNTASSLMAVNGGATLSFALGAGASTGYQNYSSPNLNSTFLTLSGTTVDQIFSNTTVSDTINLVDLTAFLPESPSTTLQLRYQNSYMLIETNLAGGSDADFANLVTTGGVGANGYVLGVSNGSGGYTAFNLTDTDINGAALASPYNNLQLYLYNGDLEVVPEPGTWALMVGGLALLIVIQRRKTS
jgi:fibronectin-binding autotransporter adhesin